MDQRCSEVLTINLAALYFAENCYKQELSVSDIRAMNKHHQRQSTILIGKTNTDCMRKLSRTLHPYKTKDLVNSLTVIKQFALLLLNMRYDSLLEFSQGG